MLKSSVRRRYKDFEAFSEALVSKYPYRLIPRMPPKKFTRKCIPLLMGSLDQILAVFPASSAFIEQRRRSLKRFMVLVVRHPVLNKDDMVKYFLTAAGQVTTNYSHQVGSMTLVLLSTGCRGKTEG